MTLDHTIRLAYINTLLDGGYTRLADKTTNPTEGYIVGGVTEPTTMELHAVATNMAYVEVVKQYADFKKLWHRYEMLLHQHTSGKYGMGMGTWIHEGQIYFDLVQHVWYNIDHKSSCLDVATSLAKERGEIAIYDCKNQKDILL